MVSKLVNGTQRAPRAPDQHALWNAEGTAPDQHALWNAEGTTPDQHALYNAESGLNYSATQQPEDTTTRMSTDRQPTKEDRLISKIGTSRQTPMVDLLADPRQCSMLMQTFYCMKRTNCQVYQETVFISARSQSGFKSEGHEV